MTIFYFVIIVFCIISYILYKKNSEIHIYEIGAVLATVSISGVVLFYIGTSIATSDKKIETGALVGKYYEEPYCYEVDHYENYECNCSTNSDGVTSCSTCSRYSHTTKESQDTNYYVVYGYTVSDSNPFQTKFSTKGDRLCRGQDNPNRIGNGLQRDYSTKNVNMTTFNVESIGNVKVWKKSYYNPIIDTDIVINSPVQREELSLLKSSLYTINDNNTINRIISDFPISISDIETVEKFNYKNNLRNISLSIIITGKSINYYNSLKRYLKNGKSNDVIIVISTQDGINIDDVNIITWNNERLVSFSKTDIRNIKIINIDSILNIVQSNINDFKEKDFSHYSYLDVELPIWGQFLIILITICMFIGGIYISQNNNLNKN